MLSDEVLDSIQILKFFHDKCISEKSIGMMQVYGVDELAKAIETILNYIGKQQKEIDFLLGKKLIEKDKHAKEVKINIDNLYVSKDKIKAKIEECEKEKNIIPSEMDFEAFYRIKDLKNIEIAVLESLLEKE